MKKNKNKKHVSRNIEALNPLMRKGGAHGSTNKAKRKKYNQLLKKDPESFDYVVILAA